MSKVTIQIQKVKQYKHKKRRIKIRTTRTTTNPEVGTGADENVSPLVPLMTPFVKVQSPVV